ncbi:MAG TPA: tail fiber protein [Rhizomicrobium sp.]|jgi:microcystin-dependent protein
MKKLVFAAIAAASLLPATGASAQAYISEVITMTSNFCPQGFALANGQFLPINQNQILFSLIGTKYGGDGKTNFALPNLSGGTIGPLGQPLTWCIATVNGVLPKKP